MTIFKQRQHRRRLAKKIYGFDIIAGLYMSLFGSVFVTSGCYLSPKNMLQNNLKEIYPQLLNRVVLNVDDNELNQLVIARILKNVGAATIAAANGEEAIEKLTAGLKPDAILMDLEMPVMNGYKSSEYIRKKIDPSVPIIINSDLCQGSKSLD